MVTTRNNASVINNISKYPVFRKVRETINCAGRNWGQLADNEPNQPESVISKKHSLDCKPQTVYKADESQKTLSYFSCYIVLLRWWKNVQILFAYSMWIRRTLTAFLHQTPFKKYDILTVPHQVIYPPHSCLSLCSALLITTVFDRDVNCRRASSVSSFVNIPTPFTKVLSSYMTEVDFLCLILSQAAFQENVGRQVCDHSFPLHVCYD